MIPNLGIEILNDLDIKKGILLDPYCGTGSSLVAGLHCGIKSLHGCDINPLATLITKSKFNKLDINLVKQEQHKIKENFDTLSCENFTSFANPKITNIDYWFSPATAAKLRFIRSLIETIKDEGVKQLFKVPFSETIRECSFARNGEFKLYRMKKEDIESFNPNVLCVFQGKLNSAINIYEKYYMPLLTDSEIIIKNDAFISKPSFYDVVLTSPPYGDSKTTVAYGQFSCLSNEWLGINHARQIDNMLMGGKKSSLPYCNSVISGEIKKICEVDYKRGLEVSSFYYDLEKSIKSVSASVKKDGTAVYIVGNRRVKDCQLSTDQFVAEQFSNNGFRHVITCERYLSNKAMPTLNSPTNKTGITKGTMTQEFVVICRKL